jgi:hypothetical protein
MIMAKSGKNIRQNPDINGKIRPNKDINKIIRPNPERTSDKIIIKSN